MFRDAIFEMLELQAQADKADADKNGTISAPAPLTASFNEQPFVPREGHAFFEQLHDHLTWPDTPGVETPRPPKFFS